MRRRRDRRPRLRVSRLTLAAAASLLVALGIAVWLYAPSPTIAEKAIAPSRTNPAVSSSGTATLGPIAKVKAPAKGAASSKEGARLVIGSVNVDVAILGGDTATALKRGVYHHAGTADPGKPGNMVVAGHRNRRQFSMLHQVKTGDTITVFWRGESHEYRVSKKLTVGPSDTWIMRQTGPERLTLYTCLPRSVGNKRTVVVALPVKR